MARVRRSSKSCLADVLDPNYDEYISYSKNQEVSAPAYQFLSNMHPQEPSDLTNVSSYMRGPITPYAEDVSYSNDINPLSGLHTSSVCPLHTLGHCHRCISKRSMEKKLEILCQELKATRQDVRVIADKVRDEVFLPKYIVEFYSFTYITRIHAK